MTVRRAMGYLGCALCLAAGLGLAGAWLLMIQMPGRSHRGPLPPLTTEQAELQRDLERHVHALASTIGERNVWRYEALVRARDYVERELAAAGYAPSRQGYELEGKRCDNVEVEIPGVDRPEDVVIVGGHYDSVMGCPGANDNGTGVAAVLVLARRLRSVRPASTLRFVAFVNEEPPHFLSGTMGSLLYARRCRERGERVTAMLSLETMGAYSDAPRSQKYPAPLNLLYPDRGDFIGFVGNVASRRLVRRAISSFRAHAAFPSEGAAAPAFIEGIGWSDHWSFWQMGYPAIMVTDTALFRYDAYHTPADTPEKVDYERLARVVDGLALVIQDLAR